MAIDSRGILGELTTFAQESGLFDTVTNAEPKSAPGRTGVSCSMWLVDYQPVVSSGLNSLSVRLEVQARIYTSMLQQPVDEIDMRVLDACDALFSSLAGRFELSGRARYIDFLGSEGERLRAVAGYLNQDGTLFRVMDIFIPIIINDAYSLTA